MKEFYDLLDNKEYKNKKQIFIDEIIDSYNIEDIGMFEYVLLDASERLRKSRMTDVLSCMIDTYYYHNQYVDIDDLFMDSILLLNVFKFKVEFLKGFLINLAKRDRDIDLLCQYESFYKDYEDRIKLHIDAAKSLVDELSMEKVLTVKC